MKGNMKTTLQIRFNSSIEEPAITNMKKVVHLKKSVEGNF